MFTGNLLSESQDGKKSIHPLEVQKPKRKSKQNYINNY